MAFESDATDLVVGDTNNFTDVYLRDLQLNTTALVSVKNGGTGSGNGGSYNHSISPDGRFVLFESTANDLVANDGNAHKDIFLRDTLAGTTTLVSANTNGVGGNNHSTLTDYDLPNFTPDGRCVVFQSDATDLAPGSYASLKNIFRRDLVNGTTVLVTQNRFATGSGNSTAFNSTISTNGNRVGFLSYASDFVALDLNQAGDAFVWDSGAFVVAAPDLVLKKSASVGAISECDNFTYTLAVTNLGAASASSVVVTDALPAGVTFVSASASQGSVTNSGGNLTASLGTLNSGSSASIIITVTAANAGSVTNTATVASSVADAAPANNTSSAIVLITPLLPPTLSATPTNTTQLQLAWPAATPSVFIVETTTNLAPAPTWTTVTNVIITSGGVRSVLLDVNPGEPARFYRLKK